jgi:hypothetical protein
MPLTCSRFEPVFEFNPHHASAAFALVAICKAISIEVAGPATLRRGMAPVVLA